MGNSVVAIGLTGGIATGKSTVSKIFQEAGAIIVDADVIARKVVDPGKPAYRRIISAFGEDILNERDKTIDRAKLGALIFNDIKKRKTLNACTHVIILTLISYKSSLPRYQTVEIYHLWDVQTPCIAETDISSPNRDFWRAAFIRNTFYGIILLSDYCGFLPKSHRDR